MRKRFLLLLLILIGGLAFVGCKEQEEEKPVDTYYKLTLPQGVTSNQDDPLKIKKDTTVVLTVTVPEGKELESLKVDDVEKKADVVSNKLSITMTKDIVVTVSFKEIEVVVEKFKLTLPQSGVTANVTDLTAIPKNTDVWLTVTAPAGKKVSSFKIDGVEKKAGLINNQFRVTMTKNIEVTVAFVDAFKLTLPKSGVTANIDDLTAIETGTDVELTVTVPEHHKLVLFKVDGVDKLNALSDANKLTVKMTKNITVEVTFESLAPTLVGGIVDWMPGAIAETVVLTATYTTPEVVVDDETGTGIEVYVNDNKLEFLTDYELDKGALKVFGQALENLELALGDHKLKVTTKHGTGEIDIHVVNDPVGTTIPTKTVQGINMRGVAEYKPTAPIADAPDLLITELGLDRGIYDYIEVFNNTSEPYNLKNHRILFAFLNEQDAATLSATGLCTYPGYTRGQVFIYQDYVIPALSKAIIWVACSVPWTVDKNTFKLSIEDPALLFGEGGLTIDKFKSQYNLGKDDLVFFTRPQYILFNNTSEYDATTGFGAPVSRNNTLLTNSSIDNRAIQIQKINQDLKQNIPEGDTTAPKGATYFKWEMGIVNKEEDVIVNGEIDTTQMKIYGKRESIEAFYLRRVFYNNANEFVGYSTASTHELNVHGTAATGNALKSKAYIDAYKSISTPISTAIFYADLSKDSENVIKNNKWGTVSLEYTLPAEKDSHLMRFVQRNSESLFEEYYDAGDPFRVFKLAGLAPAVNETLMTNDIIVPEDPGYPTAYVQKGFNTVGRTVWFNFLAEKPAE